MKFTVTRAENGWIVRVISFGLSVYKEPYNPGIYVFKTREEMFDWIRETAPPEKSE